MQCAFCNQCIAAGDKAHGFTRYFRRSKLTVSDAITRLLQCNATPNDFLQQKLCNKCFYSLSGFIAALEKKDEKQREFLNLSSQESYILQKLKPDTPSAFPDSGDKNQSIITASQSCESKVKFKKPRFKTTPIHRKMAKALKLKKQRISFQSKLISLLRTEIHDLMKKDIFRVKPSADKSDMDSLLQSLQELGMNRYPTLFAVLQGLHTKTRRNTWILSKHMLVALSLALFTCNKNCNRLQKIIGICLWKTRATVKTFRIFQGLGLSVSYMTTENLLDSLIEGFDSPVLNWKKSIIAALRNEENNSTNIHEEDKSRKRKALVTPSKALISPSKRSSKKRTKISLISAFEAVTIGDTPVDFSDMEPILWEDDGEWEDVGGWTSPDELNEAKSEKDKFVTGMSVTFDNVNKLKRLKSYSSIDQDKMINCVSLIAYFNRVPLRIPQLLDFSVLMPNDVPLDAFLLSTEDEKLIFNDHMTVVKLVLVDSVSVFGRLRGKVHPDCGLNYDCSKKKSTTVNLGLLDCDESTNEGMIRILEHLQSYAPTDGNGLPVATVARGDGLTAAHGWSAQKLRMNSVCATGKLASIYPVVSDWHKRVLLFEDDMKVLLKGVELTMGKGTLPNFRARFGHKLAGLDVKKKFNYTYEFFRFCLHSYITAFAVKELSVFDPSSGVTTLPDPMVYTLDELNGILESTAWKVVQFAWHSIGQATRQKLFCICEKPWLEGDKSKRIPDSKRKMALILI